MNPTTPAAPSSKFARYASASAVALGAAAVANAQFTGAYSLENPAASTFYNPSSSSQFGQWTFNLTQGSAADSSITTTSGASLTLFADTSPGGDVVLDFTAVAAASGNVSFDYSTILSNGAGSFEFLRSTTIPAVVTSTTTTGTATFFVYSGSTFGFRVATTYLVDTTMQLTISNFSAPTAAVPEAGTTGLLAGCAALGFIGLVGVRRSRQRAA